MSLSGNSAKTPFYPLSGSTPVPITARDTGSARLVTQPPVECTVNVTSTGKARRVTSLTAETTAGAPTTATATSLGRSCASATTVGKVSGDGADPFLIQRVLLTGIGRSALFT